MAKKPCDHIQIVLDWGITKESKYGPSLWGCRNCKVTSPDRLYEYSDEPDPILAEHRNHKADGIFDSKCVVCNNSKVLFSTGDAGRVGSMSAKKWDKELSDYREARRQGIQPAGTSQHHIEAAITASDTLGKAYNADYMDPTNKITKKNLKAKEAKDGNV